MFLIFYRKKGYVKVVEKMMIFGAVKHVPIHIMPNACFQSQEKVLLLAAGNVLNVYDFCFSFFSFWVSEVLLVRIIYKKLAFELSHHGVLCFDRWAI